MVNLDLFALHGRKRYGFSLLQLFFNVRDGEIDKGSTAFFVAGSRTRIQFVFLLSEILQNFLGRGAVASAAHIAAVVAVAGGTPAADAASYVLVNVIAAHGHDAHARGGAVPIVPVVEGIDVLAVVFRDISAILFPGNQSLLSKGFLVVILVFVAAACKTIQHLELVLLLGSSVRASFGFCVWTLFGLPLWFLFWSLSGFCLFPTAWARRRKTLPWDSPGVSVHSIVFRWISCVAWFGFLHQGFE